MCFNAEFITFAFVHEDCFALAWFDAHFHALLMLMAAITLVHVASTFFAAQMIFHIATAITF